MALTSVYKAPELKGKNVLVRVDLNVPIAGGKVVDDFRITRALPTIAFLKEKGARVLLIAHVGRRGSETLEPVFEYLKTYLKPLTFVKNPLSDEAKHKALVMENGECVLFENIRQFSEEEKNDVHFAEALSRLGSVYVNEAFSVSHRPHASIVGIPKYLPGYIGGAFEEEITHLRKAFTPPTPSLCVIGGAKFNTKLPLLKKLLPLYDYLFIGGALANSIFKARGWHVGASLVDDGGVSFDELLSSKKVMIPIDVVVERPGGARETKKPQDVLENEIIMDAGHQTVHRLGELARYSASILWNGPLGNYEKGYEEGTEALAQAVAKSEGFSIVGGGDTLAAIKKLRLADDFDFVSTGGGAMLDFLADETLPGIEALDSSET